MKSSTRDPYDILGVPASATLEDIKRAFRKKASQFHPDRNPDPDAAALFREAQDAFDLLADSDRRSAHDQRRQRHLLENSKDVARSMFKTYLDGIE